MSKPCLSVPAILLLALSGATAWAADLTKVDRTIKKEPAYQSKPKYCLLVFGPEAKQRVWLVMDGNTLYVDKDGNGDLTEEGERIKAPAFRPSTYPVYARERSVEVGDITAGGLTHTALTVSQVEFRRKSVIPNDDIPSGLTPEQWQEHADSVWRQVPEGVVYGISIKLDRKCYGLFGDAEGRLVKVVASGDRHGRLAFAGRPQDAPVVHLGGPLTLHAPGEKLRRGEDPGEVTFWLGTPGIGPGSFAVMCYGDLVPENVRPVVEVRFPAKEPGRQPVTRKYVLEPC